MMKFSRNSNSEVSNDRSFMKQVQESVLKRAFSKLYSTSFIKVFDSECQILLITWWDIKTENDPFQCEVSIIKRPCF